MRGMAECRALSGGPVLAVGLTAVVFDSVK